MNETKFAGLSLQGYKTFAKETNLVFPARITAIVGPNGSGKSNVADAIRWVLGEQSYSLLRAKKTEDMIYSGSESRPRAGMAEVSIKFDNENKWLPIDYSEVVLTRRAFRDGKNEYLINNQRVRLKDFSELLGKTGLSDRTYTIIGQDWWIQRFRFDRMNAASFLRRLLDWSISEPQGRSFATTGYDRTQPGTRSGYC